MTGHEQTVLAFFLNTLILLVMIVSGLWVGIDARKIGRTTTEFITWGVFAGCLVIVGPIVYYFFKTKIYKVEDKL